MAQLESSKRRAVDVEDFDSASIIKTDIEHIKEMVHLRIREDGFEVDTNGNIATKVREGAHFSPLCKFVYNIDCRQRIRLSNTWSWSSRQKGVNQAGQTHLRSQRLLPKKASRNHTRIAAQQ
jgi:hypothetical protein